MMAAALVLGGNIRTGLEDHLYLPNGEMARRTASWSRSRRAWSATSAAAPPRSRRRAPSSAWEAGREHAHLQVDAARRRRRPARTITLHNPGAEERDRPASW
jgi:hypothetical protein